jgi:hypothetical protein
VRLLAGEQLAQAWPQLQRRLAQAVLEDPPYALAWLKEFPHKVRAGVLRMSLSGGPGQHGLAGALDQSDNHANHLIDRTRYFLHHASDLQRATVW